MKSRAIVAALVLGISGSAVQAKPAYLVGIWGGPDIGIAFNGGLADVRLNCATGSIDAMVFPAKDGTFEAQGIYREGATGRVRVGQIFRSQPATYSGQVTKDVMTLQVELEDGTMVGPFTLARGAKPQISRCA